MAIKTTTDGLARDCSPQSELERLEAEVRAQQAELERLRASEQMYRTLVDSAQDFIFMVDRQGKLTFVNEAGAAQFGVTADSLVGQPIAALFLSGDVARQLANLERVFETGLPFTTESTTSFPGRRLYLNTWLIPVRAPDGTVNRVYGVSRDITERKKAEDALQYRVALDELLAKASQRLLRVPTPQEIDAAAVEVLGMLGEFEGVDRVSVRMQQGDWLVPEYEWVRPGVACQPPPINWDALVWGRDRASEGKAIAVSRVEEIPPEAQFERQYVLRAGIGSFVIAPILVGSEARGAIMLVSRQERAWRDTTAPLTQLIAEILCHVLVRKRAEETMGRMAEELLRVQKLESIGILAGGIAHDFNNILSAVWGNISLARLRLSKGLQPSEHLDQAEKAVQRARDLTHQLLTFAKGGAPVKRPLHLAGLLEESAGFASPGGPVLVEVAADPDLWCVEADEGQISQVIQNLVLNAVQATLEGGAVHVRAGNVELGKDGPVPVPPGRYIEIRVEDAGTGIAPENLPKVFVPYFSTKPSGIGLGLATSYAIIRKHGGHITVETSVGTGSVFTVYLPAGEPGSLIPPPPESPLRAGRGRVLVMDDEEAIRTSTGEMLKHLGYTPEFAESGTRALHLYLQAMRSGLRFDAVLMDLTVPGGMGGKEAVRELLKLDPAAVAIVCSGYCNDPVMSAHTRHGFRGVIKKPYGIRELALALQEALGGS